jgi:hypothetical protein
MDCELHEMGKYSPEIEMSNPVLSKLLMRQVPSRYLKIMWQSLIPTSFDNLPTPDI